MKSVRSTAKVALLGVLPEVPSNAKPPPSFAKAGMLTREVGCVC